MAERYRGRYSDDWHVPGPYAGVGPKGYQRSDDAILREVCELLTGHGKLDAGNIDVRVENGEVILGGTVDSRQSKRLAEELAENVFGVKDVQNQLRIDAAEQTESGNRTFRNRG